MCESLLSVGLDVGTTTTQLIVSRLQVQNSASGFAVPELKIVDRQVIYRSPVHFTPLLGQDLVDGEGVREIVEAEYKKAGITQQQVDTGAVIITGETSRKENARAVLSALSEFAGDFVVATAGPDLESVLAAKGAGATRYSETTGKPVLHMDIGGGTSNLAWIEKGKIVATGCMNVGGRLIKFRPDGKVSYVSPVLEGLTDLRPGDYPREGQVESVCQILVHGLEMAAGLRAPTELLQKLWTKESGERIPRDARNDTHPRPADTPSVEGALGERTCVISFSGGVADCIETSHAPGEFGDMGAQLGHAIRESLLCKGEYVLGSQTIRATVIGAGCHSAQLSGSTVFCHGAQLPVKNLPVAIFTRQEQDDDQLEKIIARRLDRFDDLAVALFFPGDGLDYEGLSVLAEKIAQGLAGRPVYVCLQADAAKALGQKLCLNLPGGTPLLCIDRVNLTGECYLDVGNPVGPALTVVVKTLVLQNAVERSTV